MATVPVIDVNQPIVELTKRMQEEIDNAGAPTPYFEELWYALTICLEDFEARITALEP